MSDVVDMYNFHVDLLNYIRNTAADPRVSLKVSL